MNYGKGSALVKIRYNRGGASVIIDMTEAGRTGAFSMSLSGL